jgi:hypothetical protein
MSVNTAFRVMGVFLGRTPTSLIMVHEEVVAVFGLKHLVQVVVEKRVL